MNRMKRSRATTVSRALACALLTGTLAACGGPGGVAPQSKATPSSKPVQIVKPAPPRANPIKPLEAPSVLRRKNDAAIAKAVDRYRINKRKKTTDNRAFAADLNGDGTIEVVALMTGKDWCTPAGCDLILFRDTDRGLRPMQSVKRVKAPIVVSPIGQQGWRDLIVQTGGTAGTIGQKVRLRFSGSGYPKNAMREPKVRVGIPSTGEVVLPRFGEAPEPTAAPTFSAAPQAPQLGQPPVPSVTAQPPAQAATSTTPRQASVLPTQVEPDPFRGPGPDTEPR